MRTLVLLCILASVAVADEAAKPADLKPGTQVVIVGRGLYTVVGPDELDGKPMIRFRNEPIGESYYFPPASAKDPTVVRGLVSRAEAERRVKLLSDPSPVTDTRESRFRFAEVMRTRARGTDIEQLAMLRKLYASIYIEDRGKRWERDLEDSILPELATVLGEKPDALRARIRGAHAAATVHRPAEPTPSPRVDPWKQKGHYYIGEFTVAGDAIVMGDPIYVTSKHDGPPVGERKVSKNIRIPALAGTWRCYLENDPKDPDDIVLSMIVVHDSAKSQFSAIRKHAGEVAKLWVDSGRMAAIDAKFRDDTTLDDARLFGADDRGLLGTHGCMNGSFGGDGTFTTRVVAKGGKAIAIHVDFTGETRDFLKSARAKLGL